MAYLIGRKILKDSEEFDSYAYGITLPFDDGNGGLFQQSYTITDQVKSNLVNLLLTSRGERVMQPEFGSGLKKLLFEPITPEFETRVKKTILDSVAFWLPYVTIRNIELDMTNDLVDNNKVGVYLEYTVVDNPESQEITFTVQG